MSSEQIGKGLPSLTPYAIESKFRNTSRSTFIDRYLPGRSLEFDMVLMTPDIISQLPLIHSAWKRAFSEGVGKSYGTATLSQIVYLPGDGKSDGIVYSVDNARYQHHNPELNIPRFKASENVQLELETPLRIEKKGRLINEKEFLGSLFLRQLIRRISFNLHNYQGWNYSLDEIHRLNSMADKVEIGESNLQWHDWSRYSSRQQRAMTLGGLVGNFSLVSVPPELLPFIYLGQWLHVGKGCSFGLGKYQWIPSSSLPLTSL